MTFCFPLILIKTLTTFPNRIILEFQQVNNLKMINTGLVKMKRYRGIGEGYWKPL